MRRIEDWLNSGFVAFMTIVLCIAAAVACSFPSDKVICKRVCARLVRQIGADGKLIRSSTSETDTRGITLRATYGTATVGEYVMVTSAGQDRAFDTTDDVSETMYHHVKGSVSTNVGKVLGEKGKNFVKGLVEGLKQ
jgi:hypothetical protein